MAHQAYPKPIIDSFTGEHQFLSNFYPCKVSYGGACYPSAECAYQAAKTQDIGKRLPFERMSASAAKKAGQELVLRPDWDSVRLTVMEMVLWSKFQDAELRRRLLATGQHILIEGNNWGDKYWGVCDGKGENHLGKILMMIREHYGLGTPQQKAKRAASPFNPDKP